jgi:hypothetical protein
VDARSFPVAAARDPCALPAQDKEEQTREGVEMITFHFY